MYDSKTRTFINEISDKFWTNKKAQLNDFDKLNLCKNECNWPTPSISGKAENDRNKRKGNEPSHECKYPAVRRCPIRLPSKIDGFLITEKNRQNDLFTATPRVVNSKNYTWTTWFFFTVHSANPCAFSSSLSTGDFFSYLKA